MLGCPMEDDPVASPGPPVPPVDAGASLDAASDAPAPTDAPSLRPTHAGLVSVQDIRIANLPAAGHGLTVSVLFNAARAPDYEEKPGALDGCRAWSYDLTEEAAPPLEDHGALALKGLDGGPLTCRFVKDRGYLCPTASGTGSATLTAAESGVSRVTLTTSALGAADVGRYLNLRGATTSGNSGAFAILGVSGPTEASLLHPRATAESFAATFSVLAGAGPVPNDLSQPFKSGGPVAMALAPSGGAAFAFPETSLQPGEPFTLDDASAARIAAVPVTGAAMTLGCASCGKADGTTVRITTTDADVTGRSCARRTRRRPSRGSAPPSCATGSPRGSTHRRRHRTGSRSSPVAACSGTRSRERAVARARPGKDRRSAVRHVLRRAAWPRARPSR